MAEDTFDDLNDIDVEAPGGTQATHSASAPRRGPRVRVAEGVAYVRANDIAGMRDDLEHQIREHPLRSIAIALGAGYLLSKILD